MKSTVDKIGSVLYRQTPGIPPFLSLLFCLSSLLLFGIPSLKIALSVDKWLLPCHLGIEEIGLCDTKAGTRTSFKENEKRPLALLGEYCKPLSVVSGNQWNWYEGVSSSMRAARASARAQPFARVWSYLSSGDCGSVTGRSSRISTLNLWEK